MNNKFYIGSALGSFQNLGSALPVSKVVLMVDDENAFEAGDDSGYTLTVSNPYATQQMANDLLQQARGFIYRGLKAEQVELPPIAELGDGLTVGGVYGMLANRVINFSPKFVSDVHAPWSPEVQHRYKYEGTYQRELRRGVKLGQSYFGTRITRQKGLEIVKVAADGTETSMAQLNSDILAFYDANGNEALYFDAAAGKYRFRGDVEITGGTINVNNQFIVYEDGSFEVLGAISFDATRGKYRFSGDVAVSGGSLNINQNFIVDTAGNLTLRGNIDMSNGVITWGENVPKGEKGDKGDTGATGPQGPQGPPGVDGSDGDPAAYLRSIGITTITSGSVKSPLIQGGRIEGAEIYGGLFGSIDSGAWLTITGEGGAGSYYSYFRYNTGSTIAFGINTRSSLSEFDPDNGGSAELTMTAFGMYILKTFQRPSSGEYYTAPQGNWDFSDANVTGISASSVPVWG